MIEPLWLFTPADNSIDIVGAIVFGIVLYRSIRRLFVNQLTIEGKILLIFLALISFLHIVQVMVQVFYGGPIGPFTFRVWDFINFLTAFLFLMGVERINIRERLCESQPSTTVK